jgi:histone H3/H4
MAQGRGVPGPVAPVRRLADDGGAGASRIAKQVLRCLARSGERKASCVLDEAMLG